MILILFKSINFPKIQDKIDDIIRICIKRHSTTTRDSNAISCGNNNSSERDICKPQVQRMWAASPWAISNINDVMNVVGSDTIAALFVINNVCIAVVEAPAHTCQYTTSALALKLRLCLPTITPCPCSYLPTTRDFATIAANRQLCGVAYERLCDCTLQCLHLYVSGECANNVTKQTTNQFKATAINTLHFDDDDALRPPLQSDSLRTYTHVRVYITVRSATKVQITYFYCWFWHRLNSYFIFYFFCYTLLHTVIMPLLRPIATLYVVCLSGGW